MMLFVMYPWLLWVVLGLFVVGTVGALAAAAIDGAQWERQQRAQENARRRAWGLPPK